MTRPAMTTTAASAEPVRDPVRGPAPRKARVASSGTARIAWRNLWRNRRRTWLTAGGIAFSIFLLVFATSTQRGTFELMIDNIARLNSGHLQLQHVAYFDDPKLEHAIDEVSAVMDKIDAHPGVRGAVYRSQAFALISHGEVTFGGHVVGVVPEREAAWSTLPDSGLVGRYLSVPGEAFMGSVLAKNLGLDVGEEVVVLGTAKDGGVAAAAATLVGTFTTGQVELDRSLMQIPIGDFRDAWGLGDEANIIAILADGPDASMVLAEAFADPAYRTLPWPELMPETQQFIDLKAIGANLFFSVVALIVTFSVINTFMMVVFERRNEFGMLKALGMRPGGLVAMISIEAAWLGLLGVVLGIAASGALISVLMVNGIPLPADMAEVIRQYNMPDKLYPTYTWDMALIASALMMAGTQFAAVLPAMRIRRLNPVDALRGGD